MGGPIALLKNGDRIVIDAEKGSIDVLLPDAELAARRAAWQPRKTDYQSGRDLEIRATGGTGASGRASTHPGAAAETHCYADI